MTKNSMSYPGSKGRKTTPIHDQIQITLATAKEAQLKSLVADCYPPVFLKEFITSISTKVGVPVRYKQAADGVIFFEGPACKQKELTDSVMAEFAGYHVKDFKAREKMLYCLSDGFYTKYKLPYVRENLSLDNISQYLEKVGCSLSAISAILNLSREDYLMNTPGSWYEMECSVETDTGRETLNRLIRIAEMRERRALQIQYKDFIYPQCLVEFLSSCYQVLIEIKTEIQSFGEVVEQINRYRKHLSIQKAILICDALSDMEAEGFVSQGISIYPASDFVAHGKPLEKQRDE